MTNSDLRRCILLAEDDRLVRGLMRAELEAAGYTVLTCGDGQAALDYVALGERFTVLVTDVNMPGSVDGLRLAEEARRHRPALPVIYATAEPLEDCQMVAGARLLNKPYLPGALIAAVRAAVDRPGQTASTDRA